MFREKRMEVPGIKVGHYTDREGVTGCTVVLCPGGVVAGCDVRGSAPGTRETDLLRPGNLVERVHGVLLAGGSAFGLEAAGGVMKYLEERNIGFEAGVARVPIVPGAVLFDLAIGDPRARPDARAGYQACLNAGDEVEEGSVGAGTGATVGKALGMTGATKGGLGTAHRSVGRLVVMAVAAVNAFGEVVDPGTAEILAGPRAGTAFVSTLEVLSQASAKPFPQNTTLAVVATNARLNKEQANKLAQMAQDGLARAIRPSHTMYDGDVVFALATGEEAGDINLLGALAAEAVAQAIVRAVETAQSLGGIPAVQELRKRWTR